MKAAIAIFVDRRRERMNMAPVAVEKKSARRAFANVMFGASLGDRSSQHTISR